MTHVDALLVLIFSAQLAKRDQFASDKSIYLQLQSRLERSLLIPFAEFYLGTVLVKPSLFLH